MASMSAYPLIYSVKDTVSGQGFLASVAIRGRVVIECEADEWWAIGVEPGGIASSGDCPQAAYLSFREALRFVLFDSAHLTESFDAFVSDVQRIAGQTNTAAEQRWQEARRLVREGAPIDDVFASPLPRVTTDVRCGTEVVRLDVPCRVFSPRDNEQDEILAAA